MAAIANLSIVLSADSSGVARGLKPGQDAIASLSNPDLGGLSGGMLAGITGGLSLAADLAMSAFDGMVQSAQFAAAEISKAFGRLDAVAADTHKLGIGAEELSKLQFAAGQAGIGVDQLGGLITKFQNTTAEAARTGKEGPFAELGLSAKELMGLPVSEQLSRISDALGGVNNHADKVRIAMDLFGKQGASALEFLESGTGGLRGQFEELDRIGGTLSQNEVENVAAMNDSWSKLGTAINGVWNHISAALAPALGVVAEIATDLVAEFSHFFEGSIGGWGTITKWAGQFGDSVLAIVKRLSQFGADMATVLRIGADGWRVMAEVSNAAWKIMSGNTLGFDWLLGPIHDSIKEFETLAKSFNSNVRSIPDNFFSNKVTEFEKAAERAGRNIGKRGEFVSFGGDGGEAKVELAKSAAVADFWEKQASTAKSMELAAAGSPAALEKGSEAAFSAINAASRSMESKQEIANGLLGQIVVEQRDMRRELERQGRIANQKDPILY